MNRKKILYVILACILILALVYPVVFIALESDHDCRGDDCPICFDIYLCCNVVKNLSFTAINIIIACLIVSEIFDGFIYSDTVKIPRSDLVALKVKLSR